MLAIWRYRRYVNAAKKNNPIITASNLIAFFKAYPIRILTKNRPSTAAPVGPKLNNAHILDDAP